jgi:hypothetical protein
MVEVADTQRRGLAGMDARSIETTNCWDPAERSVAQRTYEATAKDVFKFYRKPPPPAVPVVPQQGGAPEDPRVRLRRLLVGQPRRDRRRGRGDPRDGPGERRAVLREPARAHRASGSPTGSGRRRVRPARRGPRDRLPRLRRQRLRRLDRAPGETIDGVQFTPTYGPDHRPTIWSPEEWGGSIPRAEVHAAVDELHRRFYVVRMYADPRDWQSEIGDWAPSTAITSWSGRPTGPRRCTTP